MKLHTTNYTNTFITVAPDCKAAAGEVPPLKPNGPSVANLQFDLISKHPYKFTSDDILFQVHANRNGLKPQEYKKAREEFFSRGQPCLRASPLTKRYGWGVHNDQDGKVAIFGRESEDYQKLSGDEGLDIRPAMKSAR